MTALFSKLDEIRAVIDRAYRDRIGQ